MVGDRLDNDIEPASRLGMSTVRVRWPRRASKGWTPDDPEGLAYLRSLERVEVAGRPEMMTPSRTVDDLVGLVPALLDLVR